jgi:hypothetical protein
MQHSNRHSSIAEMAVHASYIFLIFCRQNQLVIVAGLRLTATCVGSARIQIKVVARLEFHLGARKGPSQTSRALSHCEFRLVRARAILQDEQKGR